MSEDHFEIFPTFSNFFRRLPTISEDFKNFQKCWKVVLSTLRQISEIFRRLPKISDDFRIFHKKLKILEGRLEHLATIPDFSKDFPYLQKISDFFLRFPKISKDFRRFPKTSEDLRRFSKVSESCRNVRFCFLRSFFISFQKNFQTFNKGDTNPYFR